jgi:type VI secretion system secreted protein VgrG
MPEQLDDSAHPLRLISPLGGDLVVSNVSGEEEMGRLFEFNLELLSLNSDIAFSDIVGQRVTVVLDLDEGERHFDGYVTEFQYTGGSERFSNYQATVKPWLWFLTRTTDCRIFQEETVPDIIKSVFRDNGMSDFDDRLKGSYREWAYCVQYRETDFNFVSRLMEQEGIYYFFEHEEGKHTMVLADDLSAHEPYPDHEKVPYFPPSGEMSVQTKDHIEYWTVIQAIQPGKYATADYDFEKPKVDMLSRNNKDRDYDYPIPDPEIFDYPGEYTEVSHGDIYSEIRLHELQSMHQRVRAGGPVRTIAPGYLFTLEDHPRSGEDGEYLAVSVSHDMNAGQYISAKGGAAEELYRCQMEVIDQGERFLAARTTPKPFIQGCQTAVVVGPSGEEIHTDKYGRVKVQFHWDRYGSKDENSSCWVRVSQAWAGKGWGSMHIPRIGQEVIVSFLEGDPDRPIITGRVYNAEEVVPYTLEANKTQSGIKSRSTKDGSPANFNEIRMEDKKGSEELYLQAEKNMNVLVKNKETRRVGNTSTVNIGSSHKSYPPKDGPVVDDNTIFADRTTLVKGNDSLTVAQEAGATTGRTVIVKHGDYTLEVKEGCQNITVAKGNNSKTVKLGNIECKASAGKITHEAAQSIELKVGASSIKLEPAAITIHSPEININADGMVRIKGMDVNAEASIQASLKGTIVKVEGSAMTIIKGGIVQIN